MRYYFNLSCVTTYKENIQVGVDANSPEEAETLVDEFTINNGTVKEFLIRDKLVLDRETVSVNLIENTELEEPANDEIPDPEIA